MSEAYYAMTDWLPIEAAPKDGTPVLLHKAGGSIVCSGHYSERGLKYGRPWRGCIIKDPTHFMPIPSLPYLHRNV